MRCRTAESFPKLSFPILPASKSSANSELRLEDHIRQPAFRFPDMHQSFAHSNPSRYVCNRSLFHASRLPSSRRLALLLPRISSAQASYIPLRQPDTRYFSSGRPTFAAEPASAHVDEATPLTQDTYHKYADSYIDTLVAELEELQEQREEVDVEYSVRPRPFICPPSPNAQCMTKLLTCPYRIVRSPHPRLPASRHLRAQQAAAESADMAQLACVGAEEV